METNTASLSVVLNKNNDTDANATRESTLIDLLHEQLDALSEHAALLNDFSNDIPLDTLRHFASIVHCSAARMIQNINDVQET